MGLSSSTRTQFPAATPSRTTLAAAVGLRAAGSAEELLPRTDGDDALGPSETGAPQRDGNHPVPPGRFGQPNVEGRGAVAAGARRSQKERAGIIVQLPGAALAPWPVPQYTGILVPRPFRNARARINWYERDRGGIAERGNRQTPGGRRSQQRAGHIGHALAIDCREALVDGPHQNLRRIERALAGVRCDRYCARRGSLGTVGQ